MKISEYTGLSRAIFRELLAQNIDCMRIMASILIYKKRVVDGIVELNENGSKEEKISNIIKDSG
jgi:hypothetical protein